MDILGMIAELRAEREQITEAILVLERLAPGSLGKRRGRPPKWLADVEAAAPIEPPKKRFVSAAARKRMADAQKKRWAKKNAGAAG